MLFKIVSQLPCDYQTPAVIHKKRELHRCNSLCSCGANGNRTSDTRIFSPLLYQLSYGTIAVLRLQRYDFFPHEQNFFLLFRKLFFILLKIKTLQLQKESQNLCFQLKIRSSLPYLDKRETRSFHFFRSSMNLTGLRD